MTQPCRVRQPRVAELVFDLELALFGYALKGLARILDAILIILAIGRQQPDNLVAAARARAADRTGGVKNSLTNLEFVRTQRRAKRCNLRQRDVGSLCRAVLFCRQNFDSADRRRFSGGIARSRRLRRRGTRGNLSRRHLSACFRRSFWGSFGFY